MSRRRKPKYRFTGRHGNRYYWEAEIPGDSRVDQISCDVDVFWGKEEVTLDEAPIYSVVVLGHPSRGVTATKQEDGRWHSNLTGVPLDLNEDRDAQLIFNPEDHQ